MKSKRKNPASDPQPEIRPPLSPGRKWLFRIMALLLPVFALGVVELGLRVAGYGYSPSFFKEAKQDGTTYLINNDTFSLRFFPSQLARWPGTLKFPVQKAPGTIRIFIFGESAAMGDPQPSYGAGRYLEMLLRAHFPDKQFEVINVAFTAINSHVILPIARECAGQNGDFWIVYMGNNEMVGPFGAATVFGSQAPPRAMVKLNLALQRLRVGQLAMAGLRQLGGKPENSTWGGMQMFLQNQIPPTDPRREMAYRNFEANLQDIVRLGLDSGAKVILNSMSVNLKDCPPFASLLETNITGEELRRFNLYYDAGRNFQSNGQPETAAVNFEQAAKLAPQHAEVQYRWAECLPLVSNAIARVHYQKACDLDALPFRADSRINAAIRRMDEEFAKRGLIFADAESALAETSTNQIAGPEAFFEHVHFSFLGNYQLGRLWAEKIASALPPTATPSNWISQARCELELGLSIWNRAFVLDSVIARLQQPPLSSQFNNATRLAALQAEVQTLRVQQRDTNLMMRTGQALVDAIQRAPRDAVLQEGFANFLEALGDRRQTVTVYQKILEVLPHDFYAKLQLGRLYGELGRPTEGEPLLQVAAQQRSGVPDVWVELGDVQMAQKKYAAALESYRRGLELRPRDPAYICYRANALAKLNRRTEAIEGYRQALQLNPNLAEAHFELAGILVAENRITEARQEYAESIRLNPRHVTSRINLGVVLVRENRMDDAIKQFEAALQIDPKNAAATEYLRQITSRPNAKN